ncbi:MAG: AIR carboxylase family protein [Desulfobacterales bacterium]|nr:AIR carboxylase family protein [Desulfobacterales bacterium]
MIGVPVSGTLNGLDALLAIAQMPKGVPVACVGVDNGDNAAWLAIRILNLAKVLNFLIRHLHEFMFRTAFRFSCHAGRPRGRARRQQPLDLFPCSLKYRSQAAASNRASRGSSVAERSCL